MQTAESTREAAAARRGYSLPELLLVMSIGATLLAMGMPRLSQLRDEQGVVVARDAVVALSARARAAAIERGETVQLTVHAPTDMVWLIAGSDTVAGLDFAREHATDVRLAGRDLLTVCYSPRGYARQQCRGTNLPDSLALVRGPARAALEVGGLGQVRRR